MLETKAVAQRPAICPQQSGTNAEPPKVLPGRRFQTYWAFLSVGRILPLVPLVRGPAWLPAAFPSSWVRIQGNLSQVAQPSLQMSPGGPLVQLCPGPQAVARGSPRRGHVSRAQSVDSESWRKVTLRKCRSRRGVPLLETACRQPP